MRKGYKSTIISRVKKIGHNRIHRRAASRANFEFRKGDKLLRGLSRWAGNVYNRKIWL